ncbi:MAG: hypothetical protein J6P79_13495 [Pseudobutyrivibrio sp.]|nr:hypothetical protein [Pseudobutyrivibrio sp.]
MKKKRIITAVVLMAVLITGAVVSYLIFLLKNDMVYKEVYIEAGADGCNAGDFLKHNVAAIQFSEDTSIELNKAGDYPVTLEWEVPIIGKITYDSTLHVQDTVAPEATLTTDSVEMYTTGTLPTAADLVESVYDVSDCSIDYKEKYDFLPKVHLMLLS